jgi:short-subunit dehydrogenase
MKGKGIVIRSITIFITIGLLVVTVGIGHESNALAKEYKKTQTVTQVNNCGNYILPSSVTCSNSNSQVQGNQNSLNSIAFSLLPFP